MSKMIFFRIMVEKFCKYYPLQAYKLFPDVKETMQLIMKGKNMN